MLLASLLFLVPDHHMFKSGVVSRFTASEHYLECTETAKALAVLTVDAEIT